MQVGPAIAGANSAASRGVVLVSLILRDFLQRGKLLGVLNVSHDAGEDRSRASAIVALNTAAFFDYPPFS
jgi:hypothetical protein